MSGVLVTGSTDGIGLETARTLLAQGLRVVVHARDERRADDVRAVLPDAAEVVVGDVASLAGTRALAEAAGKVGPFDVVVHNVGIGGGSPRTVTGDGLERIFQVNVLAPYLLTALLPLPRRLVYLTSGLQERGTMRLDDLQWETRPWDGMQAYSDSKLHDVLLALAVARRFPDVVSNAVDPGWIRTRMGGPQATDDLPDGAGTQVWLAGSDEPDALVSGRYLKRRQVLTPNPAAVEVALQERLLAECARLTGVPFPA